MYLRFPSQRIDAAVIGVCAVGIQTRRTVDFWHIAEVRHKDRKKNLLAQSCQDRQRPKAKKRQTLALTQGHIEPDPREEFFCLKLILFSKKLTSIVFASYLALSCDTNISFPVKISTNFFSVKL